MSTLSERASALRTHFGAVSGPRGFAAVARYLALRGSPGSGREAEPMAVPMKALGGQDVYVRPGTTDLSGATSYCAWGIHLPAPEIASQPLRRIAELGTNIGAGLTCLAFAYPEAEMLGVEPDPQNLRIASLNLARFGDRVHVIQAGIWDKQAELVIDPALDEHGLTVREERDGDPDDWPRMSARTVDQVLDERWPNGEEVDYMHVTIEGTEPRVFTAGGAWPERVHSLRVELHPYFDFRAEECIGLLEDLGYRAWLGPFPPDKWVFAVRA